MSCKSPTGGHYFKRMDKKEKLQHLEERLQHYEEKLAWEMKTYRGVIHESAASEIKHTKVMLYTAMVRDLKKEIEDLKKEV